jgi:hypothetical protein
MINRTTKLIILLLAILLQSCGYYSFKGALPSHLKTIAIPLFNNKTPFPGAPEDLTNQLTDAFMEDNSLAVVDESRADLILSGSVESILVKPVIVSTGETVSESKVIVKVRVKCEDTVINKTVFDKNFEDYGLMEGGGGLDERDAAIQTAIEQLTDKILNATLSGW